MQRTPSALDAFDVGYDGCGVFSRVPGQRLGGERGSIDHGVVEDGRAGVLVDALDVLGGGEAEALIGLCHQIADKNAHASAPNECVGEFPGPADW